VTPSALSARPITPPATIGILGGGQLGRMTALAARSMGYSVHILDPDGNCSAAPVADRVVAAKFDDVDAARDFARQCTVITLEIEQIAAGVLDAASAYAPTRPDAAVIGIIQDRVRQKTWLRLNGFPVGPFQIVASVEAIAASATAFKRAYVKSARGGFDGRGQALVTAASEAQNAWKTVGTREAVSELALDLAGEVSVMVARRPSGETTAFPVALNHHERHALAWSVMPAPLPATITDAAQSLGRAIAEKLGIVGLLCVEMFLLPSGELLVNELAPRPHNSYHASERACATSQFEQLVRAACDLPLGDTSVLRPAAIVNLFGDIWHADEPPRFELALETPGTRLHLYGKGDPRPARKMGHLSAVGATAAEALATARAAASRVGAVTQDPPGTLRAFGVT
jgi:5-(carboxyamino)imidazole ribonucleotide synthase